MNDRFKMRPCIRKTETNVEQHFFSLSSTILQLLEYFALVSTWNIFLNTCQDKWLFLWGAWPGMAFTWCLAHDFCAAVFSGSSHSSFGSHSLSLSPSDPASITARQAVKNTPKRLPSVTVRSPLGASPPTMDSQTDSSVPTPPMDTGGVVSDDTPALSVVRMSSHVTVFFFYAQLCWGITRILQTLREKSIKEVSLLKSALWALQLVFSLIMSPWKKILSHYGGLAVPAPSGRK